MLTGHELVERGIITGPIPEVNIQQHGVDLNLISVSKVDGLHTPGVIYNDDHPNPKKTRLSHRWIESLREDEATGIKFWHLEPGVYDITFAQGCSIPSDVKMKIVHRSSVYRNGGEINSALFDAGFTTDKMGTILVIHSPLRIENGARVGQAHVYPSNQVQNLYNGQWQGDQQRKVS